MIFRRGTPVPAMYVMKQAGQPSISWVLWYWLSASIITSSELDSSLGFAIAWREAHGCGGRAELAARDIANLFSSLMLKHPHRGTFF